MKCRRYCECVRGREVPAQAVARVPSLVAQSCPSSQWGCRRCLDMDSAVCTDDDRAGNELEPECILKVGSEDGDSSGEGELSDEEDIVVVHDSDGTDSEPEVSDLYYHHAEVNNDSVLNLSKSGQRYTRSVPPPREQSPQSSYTGPPRACLSDTAEIFPLSSPLDAFAAFVPESLIHTILNNTNVEAERSGVKLFSKGEICGFFGVILNMGIEFDTKIPLTVLWSAARSKAIYTAGFSGTRISQLIKCIRFDDKSTRSERRENDNFAPMREIFEMLNEIYQHMIVPGPNCTIGDVLTVFRGKCSFKVFMKEKPGKYGILMRMLSDSDCRYVYRMEVYSGLKDPAVDRKGPALAAKRLVEPLRGSGRNVTGDRHYSSVELAEELYTDYNLTYVGTLDQNSKHVPQELKQIKDREECSSEFLFTDPLCGRPPVTIQSYITQNRPKKNLLLISTRHEDVLIDESDKKKKSHINLFYNATRGGVDEIDRMVRLYSCKRGTRRWPLACFYTLLDITTLNSYTLFTLKNPDWHKSKLDKRRLFLFELAESLVKISVQERSENLVGLTRPTLLAMELILGHRFDELFQSGTSAKEEVPASKKRCYRCVAEARSKRQKYNHLSKMKQVCDKCSRTVCTKHSGRKVVCNSCACTAPEDQVADS